MPGCFVKHCNSRWRNKDTDVTMHVFPRDQDMIKKWLQRFRAKEDIMEELSLKIKESRKGGYRVCSRHFTNESYEQRGFMTFLKKDAMPTLHLEEEITEDHIYSKRRRILEKDSSKNAIYCPNCEDVTSNPSTSYEEYDVNPYHVYVSPVQLSDCASVQYAHVQAIEEVDTTLEFPMGIQEADVYSGQMQRKKKRVRHTRNVSTTTEYLPSQRHKQTQFDKAMGAKDRNIQVFRRLPHRSIAVQCNLVDLPSLDKFPDRAENYKPPTQARPIHKESRYAPTENEEDDDEDEEEEEEDDDLERKIMENQGKCIDPNDVDISYMPIREAMGPVNHVEENKFIVFESCLDKLLKSCRCLATRTCRGSIVRIRKYKIGSAVAVTASCSLKHHFHLWRSQPVIGNMPVGNLLISASILCSNSNFSKVEHFFRLLGLLGISSITHYNNQTAFLFPTINFHWKTERAKMLKAVHRQPLAVVGDSLLNSPRSSNKYCTYNFLEYESKKIIDFQVDQLKPGIKAKEIRKEAFQRTLDRLLAEKVDTHVVCTDRHSAISKLLKTSYRKIKHQFGIWYVAKSVGSKLAIASQKPHCAKLAYWIAPAKKHLWWAARTCSQNPTLLQEKWESIIHHAANQHQWQDASMYKKCCHKKLLGRENNRQWLEPESAAHHYFKKVVLNKKLIKDLHHLSNFCHAGEIEILRNTTFKYRSKQSHYSIDELVARTQLAALDYNNNIDKMQDVIDQLTYYEAEGEAPKKRNGIKEWLIKKIYEPTNQEFIKYIQADVCDLASGYKNFPWKSRKEGKSRTI